MNVASMWDDGLMTDLKILEIVSELNLTTCFAISPGKHEDSRVLNDIRSPKYGTLVSKAELSEFSSCEICNHTANHLDLSQVDEATTCEEIRVGKCMLEDIFGHEVVGFCHPYGVGNSYTERWLKATGHLYARTTRKKRVMIEGINVNPTCKWNEEVLDVILQGEGNVLFWGHSYEVQDWDEVKRLYKALSYFNVVTVEQMVRIVNAQG